jgi:mRNA interferase MazF
VEIPQKGDVISITLDPQSGQEQMGRRPALVISNDAFNRRVGLAMVCPLTNTARGVPFHLPIPAETGLTGFVMVEQLKSLDYRRRGAKRIGQVSSGFLEEVLDIVRACIEKPSGLALVEDRLLSTA